MNADDRLIVALDTADLDVLGRLAAAVSPHAGLLKVGLEAFAAHGPRAVGIATDVSPVFLDLKLHDIPNTVAGAARAVSGLGVSMLTVHAAGGPRMIEAAVQATPGVTVLAVTALTSLDDATLTEVGQPPAAELVPRLARLAVEAGAGGLVCAPTDVAVVREAVGDEPVLVTPGEAVAAGADFVVVGRPITAASDPAEAAAAIAAELRG